MLALLPQQLLTSATMASNAIAVGVASAILLYAAYRVVRFARADSNLGKALAPKGAFKGKVVWIIGASQVTPSFSGDSGRGDAHAMLTAMFMKGLGSAIAKYFTDSGAKIIISARKLPDLERVAERCGGASVAAVVALDITKPIDELRLAAPANRSIPRTVSSRHPNSG